MHVTDWDSWSPSLHWQAHRLMIYGKGGPYGIKSKRRVIPLTARIQPLIKGYFALHETVGFSARPPSSACSWKHLDDGTGGGRTIEPEYSADGQLQNWYEEFRDRQQDYVP